ncbi:uncharacterized protein H6S33_008121 [Morchella sextelata]|uniref:uncharacterized protein n=1 Tax=Morchella sextelata TaxID=1174677 RepID=UPI001D04DC5A|nr:uncharacterized protein H6S33_008121 [Morchella sextelata]KAH0603117.1 hypothetical protein H6S33_008121 [Morchella sextelata]
MDQQRSSSPVIHPGNTTPPARSIIITAHLSLLYENRASYESSYGCISRDVESDIRHNRLYPCATLRDNIGELLAKKWRIRALLDQINDDIEVLEGYLRSAIITEAATSAAEAATDTDN